MKILFVHLLNNYTGSPRVLANLLEFFSKDSCNEIHLLTSDSKGFLSDIKDVNYHWNKYKWIPNKLILSFLLLFSQVYQFFFVLFSKRYDCVYINTILPFGAAVAAKLRREKILYHVHEFYPVPNLMQKVCVREVDKCANRIIFVSEYLKNCYKNCFLGIKNCVVYNSLSSDFERNAEYFADKENYIENKFKKRLVVLPCALKKYKGVSLFLELARMNPDMHFLLVVSNPKAESDCYFKSESLPANLEIQNEVQDMPCIYNAASVVMNLSIPHGIDRFIETFSMILLEAFSFKVPCIAPCYGGPLEIVENGKNGFLLETENLKDVSEKIRFIMSDFACYKSFCENAFVRSKKFSAEKFFDSILNIIKDVIS